MQENGDNDNNGCTKGMYRFQDSLQQNCTPYHRMPHYHDIDIERASKLITKMCNNAY